MKTPEQTSRLLAQVVGDAMKAAGLSQRAVSDATGIPLVTLNRRLTGRTAFTVPEVAAIAEAVHVSVIDLFLRVERMLPAQVA